MDGVLADRISRRIIPDDPAVSRLGNVRPADVAAVRAVSRAGGGCVDDRRPRSAVHRWDDRRPAFAFSIVTIRHKIAGLVEVGERADAQLKQVLTFVPPNAQNKRIMLLFERDELPPRRTYSVFRMGDEILLVHEPTLEWYRPGHRHVLQSIVVDDPATFDRTGWDVVLMWDAKTQRFSPLPAREGN